MSRRLWVPFFVAMVVFVLAVCGCSPKSPSSSGESRAEHGAAPSALTDRPAPAGSVGGAAARAAEAPPGASAHVTHYDLDVVLDPPSHSLEAAAACAWQAVSEVSEVSFDLRSDLRVTSLTDTTGEALEYDRDEDGRMTVRLRESVAAGEEFTIRLAYAGVINGPLGGANNQRVWDYIGEEGTYVRFEAGWYPMVTGDRATADLAFDTPEGWTVVSSGSYEPTDDGRSHWKVTFPAGGLSFAAAPYEHTEDASGPVPVHCYVYPKHADRAETFAKLCSEILALYGDLYSPYPFERFSVVEIPDLYGGGHGDQGFVMLQSQAFEGEPDAEFLAHEMAHNWWGGLLSCSETEFPIEGFATYSQALWREHTDGPEGLRDAMLEQAEAVLINSIDNADEIPCYESDDGPLLYEKGAWILHMLRRLLGDEKWRAAVKSFCEANGGRDIACADLEKAFSDAYGEPLDGFFEQWLYGTGVPWVRGEMTVEGGETRVTLNQVRIVGSEPDGSWKTEPSDFRLLVDVLVKTPDGEERAEASLEAPSAEVIVPGEGQALAIDPDCWVLEHSKGLVGELDRELGGLGSGLGGELEGLEAEIEEELRRELGALGE